VLDPDTQWHHLLVLTAFATTWTVPASAFLAVAGARARGAGEVSRALTRVAVVIAAAAIVLFVPTLSNADDGAPARYLSTLLVPLALLAGPGWIAASEAAARLGTIAPRLLAGLGLALALGSLGAVIDARLPALWIRDGLYRAVADQGIRDAVVVVRAQYPTRYLRNGPFFDRDVLYAMPDRADAGTLARWFPGRSIYEADEGGSGRPWELRRLDATR
jgi:hypothetical protein